MKRTYLLIYSDKLGTREEIRAFLDKKSEILNWRYDLPHTFYLVSDLSAEELYEVIQSHNQERGFFLIGEVGQNTQGWLPAESWVLLNAEHARH